MVNLSLTACCTVVFKNVCYLYLSTSIEHGKRLLSCQMYLLGVIAVSVSVLNWFLFEQSKLDFVRMV